MTTEPVDGLAHALDVTGSAIAAVRDEQWANPTPCPDWNVRALVNHLVGGNRLFATILRGEPPAGSENGPRGEDDHLGGDPLSAYSGSAGAVLAAFRQPDVFDRVFSVPFGSVPGIVALHLRITEALVHGWDLCRATGQAARFPDDLAEQELRFSRDKLADIPADRHPFAPPQPVAEDAPAIDRLAALLGREVTPRGSVDGG